jgi:arginine-tRNA-protein transferase
MALPPPLPVRLTTLPSHDCNYLPGRMATTRAFRTDRLPGEIYHQFMDAGFRRSGTVIYQPICEGCQACVPIRVPVKQFQPSRSQRRSRSRNQDLSISIGPPELTDEKFELYLRYVTEWHGKSTETGEVSRESMRSFLYESPVDTVEFCYRDPSGDLLGVGICDVCQASLSSVYFYFDPRHRSRSLGTFSATLEIETAGRWGIEFYYLGFWVSGCAAMEYKRKFELCQILAENGRWQDLPVLPIVQIDAP